MILGEKGISLMTNAQTNLNNSRREKSSYSNLEWLDEDVDFIDGEGELSDEFGQLFNDALNKGDDNIREGQVVKGKIIEIKEDDDLVVIDIGHKSLGEISKREFLKDGQEFNYKVGDTVDVYIEVFEDEEGELVLSKDKADMLKAWDNIAVLYEQGKLIEGKIISRVKGGLSVDIGVKAFLPGSQVDLRPVRNLDKLLGKVLKFKIIKFNKKRGNIVLSRRVLLERDREKMRVETLKSLEVGSVMDGIVKNITDYGAFIDLGGIDGLLHITDMSWGRLNSPSEILHVGDDIKVKVLSYEPESNRVSLGLKQLQNDPWVSVAERYKSGQKISGKIVSLADYGAFVELEPGVEGLIHITEMTWNRRIKHPSKVVNIGDDVEAVILAVDLDNHRISLGLKQTEPNPWEVVTQKYHVGDIIRGKIRNITDFGVFVGIEDGVDGLIHVSDISWTEKIKHPQEFYNKGDEVEAKVLQIDIENMRFSLGVKQLKEDPFIKACEKYKPGEKVKGKVFQNVDFGVFIEIEPGVDGLIPSSELESKDLSENSEVEATVIKVDTEERRFELSEKASARGLINSNAEKNKAAKADEKSSLAEAFARAQKPKE